MNFEVLKKNHLKRNILIAVSVVLILSAVILTFTKAKYRTTQSMPLLQGTINFSTYDFNVVAMYLNKGDETVSTKKAPHVGYTLNSEQSSCVVGDAVAEGTEIVYENGNLYFNQANYVGTKCTVYFDLIPDSEDPVINSLSIEYGDSSITVKANATDNIGIFNYYFKIDQEEEIRLEENTYTFEGLETGQTYTISIRVEDATGNIAELSRDVIVGLKGGDAILANDNAPTSSTIDWTGGTTYYYTGKPNNWIQFAGFYWRIIRINGDKTIRIIYSGNAETGPAITGEGTQIETSAFNSTSAGGIYVGYTYGSGQHGYGTNSRILTQLNTWYNNNLVTNEQFIDIESEFCSDRNMANGSNWGAGAYAYAAHDRVDDSSNASLLCNSEDLLSKSNGKLPNPIGLITSDEVLLTGITYINANTESYLYTGLIYWTLSPGVYDLRTARVFYVDADGTLDRDAVTHQYGVRPVINLRADVQLTGSGTTSDPFKVVGAS